MLARERMVFKASVLAASLCPALSLSGTFFYKPVRPPALPTSFPPPTHASYLSGWGDIMNKADTVPNPLGAW